MISIEWVQPALAGAILLLGVVLALELRSVARLRRSLNHDMARLFEQLDLVRFDSQQLADAAPTVSAALPVVQPLPVALPPGANYAAALQLAADGADPEELVARCGMSRGEARILASMHSGRRSASH